MAFSWLCLRSIIRCACVPLAWLWLAEELVLFSLVCVWLSMRHPFCSPNWIVFYEPNLSMICKKRYLFYRTLTRSICRSVLFISVQQAEVCVSAYICGLMCEPAYICACECLYLCGFHRNIRLLMEEEKDWVFVSPLIMISAAHALGSVCWGRQRRKFVSNSDIQVNHNIAWR